MSLDVGASSANDIWLFAFEGVVGGAYRVV